MCKFLGCRLAVIYHQGDGPLKETNMTHRRTVESSLLATILVAGCSGGQPVQPFAGNQRLAAEGWRRLGAAPQASAYRMLYSFGSSGTDGTYPGPGLIDVNGTLYGVTFNGGRNHTGTVYSIKPTGAERILHDFGGPGDGQFPLAGAALLDVNGTLYGTTWKGGSQCATIGGCGAVYSIGLTGDEKVVYSFNRTNRHGTGATNPECALVNVNGILYGTTASGGKYDDATLEHGGTVFRLDPTTGSVQILHDFGGGTDGRFLQGPLVARDRILYGVTNAGGTVGRKAYGGYGTVFRIDLRGNERVLHNFGRGNDGTNPYDSSALLDVNGTLYGTTTGGGKYNVGTVFSISLGGAERVLHFFGGSGDGAHPTAGLIDVNGTLYGTTSTGGKYNGGTIFSISPAGVEQVLHDFGQGTDGQYPQGGLLDVDGTLYGTTTWGGKYGDGSDPNYGTVFALTLPQ